MKNTLLQELELRGFLNQCSNIDGLNDALNAGPITLYEGTDPTADSFHVGHLVPIMMMRWFKKFGHNPILLIGGATGRIGDPSMRDTDRPMLDDATITRNLKGLRKSLSKIIDADIPIVDNYDWHKTYGHLDFLREFGIDFTVPRMLAMESVKRRLDTGMTFLEFNYMPLQAVDFYELHTKYNCILQICGADQWGNSIGGIDLIRKKLGRETFVLSTALITDNNGNKIGKSAGNAIWINEDKTSPFEFYQYFRNVADTDLGTFLKLFTEIPLDEIATLAALPGETINTAKKLLAFAVTETIHGTKAAKNAEAMAESLFGGGGDNAPTIKISAALPMTALDFVMLTNLFKSKSDARRTIEQGGLTIANKRINSADEMILPANDLLIQKGKKIFLKVIIK